MACFTEGDWGDRPSGQSVVSSYLTLSHCNLPGPVTNTPLQGTGRAEQSSQLDDLAAQRSKERFSILTLRRTEAEAQKIYRHQASFCRGNKTWLGCPPELCIFKLVYLPTWVGHTRAVIWDETGVFWSSIPEGGKNGAKGGRDLTAD